MFLNNRSVATNNLRSKLEGLSVNGVNGTPEVILLLVSFLGKGKGAWGLGIGILIYKYIIIIIETEELL